MFHPINSRLVQSTTAFSQRSGDSGLRLIEHVEKHGYTEACQQMNERCQHRYRSNRTSKEGRYVTDEHHRQQNGYKRHADQGEKRRILEGHDGSIALAA